MTPGFALAETLVALAVAGLLLGGMIQVTLAGLGSLGRVNGALAVRRSLDWALARMAADLELAGHLLPLPGRAPVPAPEPIGWPGGWRLVPDGPAAEPAFAYDRPAPASLRLAEALAAAPDGAGPGPGILRVRAHRTLRLHAGDLVLAPGERFGWATAAAGAELAPGRTLPVPLGPAGYASGWAVDRPANVPLEVVRPDRLVRFAVVPLGPGNVPGPGGTPCLVRFETVCPASGREPRWTGGWGRGDGARAPGIRREVLARGVTAFRVAFTPAGDRRPAGFQVDLAVAGPGPGGRAAGTLRVALRTGGR